MNSVSPSTAAVAGIVAGIAAGLALSTLLTAGKEYQEDISDNVRGSHHSLTPEAIIGRLEREFSVSSIRLHGITKHFVAELHRGLERDGLALKMIPSYVTRRPTGNEQGSYLALDLGGSNFRVCEVALEGAGRTRVRQKKHVIDAELKTGPADALFDFIASRVADFLQSSPESMGDASSPTRPSQKNIQAQKKTYKLGFTFSFPVQQTAINRGTIMYWNKGFDCGSEGKDVVELLQAAFQRQSIDNVEVAALVNDTVGTLIAHAYEDPQTSAAVILGTGTNAAYFEQLSQISKHSTSFSSSSDAEMIINTEWGNFDSARLSLPVTSYDLNLDRATSNPGIQIFEKMISGLYLGEIVRLVLVELVQTGEIFSGKGSDVLNSKGGFESAYMSRIERDHSQDLSDTKILLTSLLHIRKSSTADRQLLKRICELVGIRSARLSAAGIAALVTKMNTLNGCTVAIDGSLFEHYPHYANRVRDALRELLGVGEEGIVLELARDGSGTGAALIAALSEPL